jgi:hypothetical protein
MGLSIEVHRLNVPDDVAVRVALFDGRTRSGISSRWSTTLEGLKFVYLDNAKQFQVGRQFR